MTRALQSKIPALPRFELAKTLAAASTPRSSDFIFHKEPSAGVAAAVALFVCACLSIWMTRGASGVALLWPGNAIAACLLIKARDVRWSVALPAVFAAALLANVFAAHRAISAAALFASAHVLEIALMVLCFRFVWKLPYPKITINQAALMTAVLGVAIPGLGALLASSILQAHITASFDQRAMQWWSSHVLGACLVGPVIILYSQPELIRLTRARFLTINVFTVVGTLVACYFAIRFVRFPFALIGLMLLSAAFRLGGFGAAVLSLAVGFSVANLWLIGIRPVGLDEVASASTSLIGLPVVALLAALMPPITVGIGSDARRAAAKAILASERRFREAMEYSPIGTLLADMSGVWGYTNIALQKMLGYSAI